MIIYVVQNGAVLAIYLSREHAEIHSRTATGSRVTEHFVLSSLPSSVLDDINSDDWWDQSETPVTELADILDTETKPSTPSAKAKKKSR